MLIHWNASPELLDLGFLHLRWYGMMFFIGFTVSYYFMQKICRWEKKPMDKMESLLTYLVVGTTIGARLGHCLFYDPGFYLAHPLKIFEIWEGGLASHGGGIGIIVAALLFSRNNPQFSPWWLLDRISVFVVMSGALVRFGNLMNSEILGKPTDGTWGVIFDHVDQIPRHPAMIYESICYAIIFAVTYRVYLHYKERTPHGLLFGLTVGSIMICRFFIEFFKEIQSPFEKGMALDMGQILSLPYIAVAAYLVWRALRAGPPVVGSVDSAAPVGKESSRAKKARLRAAK